MKDIYKAAAAVIVLIMCLTTAFIAQSFVQEDSSPEKGASAEGLWHQTASKGYFNGAKMTETYEINDLTIEEYKDYTDPQHFLKCKQRGYDFLAVRYDDSIYWNYATEAGSFLAIATCYGNCMIVDEFSIASGDAEETYISSNIYTKDGTIPSWVMKYWDYKLTDQRWVLHDAGAVSDSEDVTLGGKSLYMLDNNGPTFKAEMEQSVGTTISTKSMKGVITDYDESGYMFAMAIDDTYTIWFMAFKNGNVMASAVTYSDFSGINGMVSVLRRYTEVFDPNIPVMDKPVLPEYTNLQLKGITSFTKDGPSQITTEGNMAIDLIYESAFHSSLLFTDTEGMYNAGTLGFTLPAKAEGQNFVYVYFSGDINGQIAVSGGGIGFYDTSTGVLTYTLLLTQGYTCEFVEFTFQKTS